MCPWGDTYSGLVKEFWIYTGMRIGLFLSTLLVVFAIWGLASDTVPIVWVVAIAFAVSGVASYFLLNRQREAFARKVDERAQRISTRFEEAKAKEDVD